MIVMNKNNYNEQGLISMNKKWLWFMNNIDYNELGLFTMINDGLRMIKLHKNWLQ